MAREGKPPAFQFYAKEWITRTRELPPLARAMLIDLMAQGWDNGSVPADLGDIARATGLTLKQARGLWPKISHRFTADGAPPGRLVESSLEVIRKKQDKYREDQAKRGRASGEARRNGGSNRKRTSVQQAFNKRSRPVGTGYEPKVNSAISDLQSPMSSPIGEDPPVVPRKPRNAKPTQAPLLVPQEPVYAFDFNKAFQAYPQAGRKGEREGTKLIAPEIKTPADFRRFYGTALHVAELVATGRIEEDRFVPQWVNFCGGKWLRYEPDETTIADVIEQAELKAKGFAMRKAAAAESERNPFPEGSA